MPTQFPRQVPDPEVRKRLIAPVQDFLHVTAQRTRDAIPAVLESGALKRHYANFRRYLAARQDLLRNVTLGKLEGLRKSLDARTPIKENAARETEPVRDSHSAMTDNTAPDDQNF